MLKIVNLFGKHQNAFARYREQRMRELRFCNFSGAPIKWFTGPETIIHYDENGKAEYSITTY